jgi:Mrp family chromosome partitioning ATPase
MSAIDRAFIRAYEIDGDAEVTPAVRTAREERRSPRQSSPTNLAAAPHFATASPAALPDLERQPTERRPLSAFAPAPSTESRFQPSFEVDAFPWGMVADELVERHATRWRQVASTLLAADESGQSLIGIGGLSRRAGCTTVVGCLARLLTEAGKTVAMVDGHFAAPGLAASLGIAAEIGWEDVLAGRVPLAECAVYSLRDRMALLPLVQGGVPAAEKLDGIHASVTAGVLRYHYDVVLFDLGAVLDDVQGPIARRLVRRCRLDAAILVAGPDDQEAARSLQDRAPPELAGICLGMIENLRADCGAPC